MVDNELDLSGLDERFRNDEVGASAYDPRVMLKIVLLGYSRGLISSRAIERACVQNVVFIALSGDSHPSHGHIAKFVRQLGEQIKPLFTQVLMTCDRLGLIGRQMFAIDGVKLPSNASKERSGTHAELRHRAERLDKAAARMIELHKSQDNSTQEPPAESLNVQRVRALQREAQATRELLARGAGSTGASSSHALYSAALQRTRCTSGTAQRHEIRRPHSRGSAGKHAPEAVGSEVSCRVATLRRLIPEQI